MKYLELCEVYEKLFSTTKRLEKTYHTSLFLKKVNESHTNNQDLDKVMLLLQGKVFPNWDDKKIGVAARLILKALSQSTGASVEKIEEEWKKTGDLGLVAEMITKTKSQVTLFSKELTVAKVFANLQKIESFEGEGTVDKKIQLISELLTSATPIEAKYITRTVLEEMRVGLGEGTLRDAIVWAFFAKPIGVFFECEHCKKIVPLNSQCIECTQPINTKNESCTTKNKIEFKFEEIESHKSNLHKFDAIITDSPREVYNYIVSKVQTAFDLSNDFASVVNAAKEGIETLEKIKIIVGQPIKVMLALKEANIGAAFARVGKPAALEFKYDGFRMLIHKDHDKITIYTRRLENVTNQFPEVVELLKKHIKAKVAILDSEAVGFDPTTKRYLPFQKISQRIKRKYDIVSVAKKFPVELNLFDIIYLEGKNLLNTGFLERRKILESVLQNPIERQIVLAKELVTEDESAATQFYQKSISEGNEGVMFKTIDAPYKPGARVGYMVKLKSAKDPLDLVIVGADWGEGKRKGWLSSFIIACQDPETGELLEVGRVGTGIKEKETENKQESKEGITEKSADDQPKDETAEVGVTFLQLTELLKPLIISEKGKEIKVKPKIVISVIYEEVQKSPTYSSGYALRFPRLVALRDDRNVDDIATLEEIEEIFISEKDQ